MATPSHTLLLGPSGGVGRAVEGALRREGVRVSAIGRRANEAFQGWHASVAFERASWGELYTRCEHEVGQPIDSVVYAAGTGAFGRAEAIPQQNAREVFEVNFWALSAAAVALSRHWAKEKRSGTFIGVLSIAARRAVPYEAYYGASKAAAARFLEVLDLEQQHGARFLALYPGMLDTPFRARMEWFGEKPPPSGPGNPPEIVARAVLRMLRGSTQRAVLGWRENAIDLADRISPRLYDEMVLRRRMRR
jgi:short-subunit dehydrogenase